MVKIKISPERFSDACNIYEYLAILSGDEGTCIRVLPRFVTNTDGEYIIVVTHDADGDIQEYANADKAVKELFSVTPKRIEKLVKEFREAAKNIVNPTNAGA